MNANRNLAPEDPAITSGALHAAVTRATWIMANAADTDPVSRSMARALLYLWTKLQGETVIVEGDTLKFSVALLRDLYDMPAHESVTVRFIRGPVERDGSRLLLLQDAGAPWVCARHEPEAAE